MGIAGIATEAAIKHLVEEFAEEVALMIEKFHDQPKVVEELQRFGRHLLNQLETKEAWVAEYEKTFGVPHPKELDLSPEAFFTTSRFAAVGTSQGTITSACKGIQSMLSEDPVNGEKVNFPTMKEFLERYPRTYPFTRVIGMGPKSVDAIVAVLRAARMPFRYPH